jgi:hypothetical protein
MRSPIHLLLLLLLILPHAVRAFEDPPAGKRAAWSSRIDGGGSEIVRDMFTDPLGNVYVVGGFNSADAKVQVVRDISTSGPNNLAQTHSRNLQNSGGLDVFVVKYNSDGTLAWARSTGGGGDDEATGVSVDQDGNIFVTGWYSGSATVGGTVLNQPSLGLAGGAVDKNLFVAMLTPGGNWLWAKPYQYEAKVYGNITQMAARINFTDDTYPSNYPGYIDDLSYGFGDRGVPQPPFLGTGNYQFGWKRVDNNASFTHDGGRNRNHSGHGGSQDERYDSLTHLDNDDFGPERYWEIRLPNGTYDVTLAAGDSANTDSIYKFNINGYITDSFKPVSSNKWKTWYNIRVSVTEERLTIRRATGGSNVKINFVNINSVSSGLQAGATLAGTVSVVSAEEPWQGKALALDEDGSVYVKGWFAASTDLRPNALSSYELKIKPPVGDEFTLRTNAASGAHGHAFVTRLKRTPGSAGGSISPADWQWDWTVPITRQGSSSTGEVSRSSISALRMDDEGNLLVAGKWRGLLTGGGASLETEAGQEDDGFVMRLLRPTGSRVTHSVVRGPGVQEIAGITPERDGGFYLAGTFQGLAANSQADAVTTFFPSEGDGVSLSRGTGGSRANGWVARADSAGQWLWAERVAQTQRDVVFDVAADVAGGVYVTGSSPALRSGWPVQGDHRYYRFTPTKLRGPRIGMDSSNFTVIHAYSLPGPYHFSVNSLSAAEVLLYNFNANMVQRHVVVSPHINYNQVASGALPATEFGDDANFPLGLVSQSAVRAYGTLVVTEAGSYTFGINNDDGGRLRVNGQTVINDDALHGPLTSTGSIFLNVGSYPLEYIFFNSTGGACGELFWYDNGVKRLVTRAADAVQLSELEMSFEGARLAGATATNPGGSNPAGQGPDNAMDGDLESKWYDSNRGALLLDFGAPVRVDGYSWATADDQPTRDPVRWRLEGSNNGSDWTLLDDRTQADHDVPETRKKYLGPAGGSGGQTAFVAKLSQSGGSRTWSGQIVTPQGGLGTMLMAIDCGGGGYTKEDGTVFVADAYASGGTSYNISSEIDILGTVDDPLWRSQRFSTSSFAYNIPVPNGQYRIGLMFASDTTDDSSTVTLEGQTVLSNFKFAEQEGLNTPITRHFDVSVSDGTLDIGISKGSNGSYGIITGIVVEQPATAHHGALLSINNSGTVLWMLSSGTWRSSVEEAAGDLVSGYNVATTRTGATQFDSSRGYGAFLFPMDYNLRALPSLSASPAFFVGQYVEPPPGVLLDGQGRPVQPEIFLPGSPGFDFSPYFHWDAATGRLYVLQPISGIEIRWRVSANPLDTARITQIIQVTWPTDEDILPGEDGRPFQLLISGGGANENEPAVDIEPVTSHYTLTRLESASSGATLQGKTLQAPASQGSIRWCTLLYNRKPGAPADLPPTLALPLKITHFRDMTGAKVPTDIGQEIIGAAHGHNDPFGKNGFVMNLRSRFDGEGNEAAHNRLERTGPIIPVNTDEAGIEDDLVVAWYSVNPKTGTPFPTTAVLYEARWPEETVTTTDGVSKATPEKIFIASQLGSDMTLYGTVSPLAVLALNSGSVTAHVAGDATYAWDAHFTGGSSFVNDTDITGTADPVLYQSGRRGPLINYALPTGNGNFVVSFLFAEPEPPAPVDPDEPAAPPATRYGARVTVEGVEEVPLLLIADQAGDFNKALTIEVPVTVTDGTLNLELARADGYDAVLINAVKVTPASLYQQDKLNPAKFVNRRIYHQPDKTQPGYNPNEEHALLAPASKGSFDAVFALRNDLNHRHPTNAAHRTSDPYVLMKYQDGTDGLKWKFKVYAVSVTGSITIGSTTHTFDFTHFAGTAGKRVQAPYPLSLFTDRPETTFEPPPAGIRNAYWKDHKGGIWARSEGQVIAKYWYAPQPGFWLDVDGNGSQDTAAACPWLQFYTGPNSTPNDQGDAVQVIYDISWPPLPPQLYVGETLRAAKRGLPDVMHWAAGALIFDENEAAVSQLERGGPGSTRMLRLTARLLDSMGERAVDFPVKVAGQFLTDQNSNDLNLEVSLVEGGRYEFPHLPPHLRPRLRLDMSTVPARLIFRGLYDTSQPAAPLELLNVLSRRELTELRDFDERTNSLWDTAASALFELTRNPNGVKPEQLAGVQNGDLFIGLQRRTDLNGGVHDDIVPETVYEGFALTAGLGEGEGYITLSENNDPALGALPVALHVIRVVSPAVTGSLRVVLSQDPLDEKITLRHSADFGGDPDGLVFEWYVKQDNAGRPDPLDVPPAGGGSGWLVLDSGLGLNSITIEGSGIRTLADHWAYCRYRRATAGEMTAAGLAVRDNLFPDSLGGYAGDPAYVSKNAPMFVPGWIKRVLEGITPFEQRVKDFHQAPTASYVSMIQQAGGPYQGPVALNSNADNLNSMGLIELYETIVRRGFDLSINGIPSQSNGAVNNALLLAASRISDLYMLLGNEASADAQDPTIGTSAGGTNVLNSSSFSFQNQLPGLIEEELALLRGRDDTLAGVEAAPVFNRLYWNFTSGLEGEPAYVLNYEIGDTVGAPAGGPDGFIRENDAAVVYPMGHGDAWGHYLSAVKSYYRLLRHPLYTWTPRSETTIVAGVSVTVDYLDEVKFARAAAARAKAAESIVDLTYRNKYVSDPAGQWQGYKDTDTARAWGVDEWARRAGQGVILDWAVANAVLPEESPPGTNALSQIDRQTVGELTELASAQASLQGTVDRADQGLNPLGLHNDVVPFDIDVNPTDTLFGQTHFEQIYERSTGAVANARNTFDHASSLTQQLRSIAVTAEQYRQEIAGQETDYKNQLISIFGYPYSGDIGPGKTYPTSYVGPDLYKYMYVPVADLTGDTMPPVAEESTAFYQSFKFESTIGPDGTIGRLFSHYFPDDVSSAELLSGNNALPMAVTYELSAGRWAFNAGPAMGARRAPGRLQMALNTILEAQAGVETAKTNYDGFVLDVKDAAELLQARYNLQDDLIKITTRRNAVSTTLSALILTANITQESTSFAADIVDAVAETSISGLPEILGPLAADPSSGARLAVNSGKNAATIPLRSIALGSNIAAMVMETAKAENELWTELEIDKAGYKYEIQEQLKSLEQLLRNEINMRLEIFQAQRRLEAAVGDFQATLAEGQRLMEERVTYRRKMAGPVQQLRYQDITFRNYRNEALQRYKASFDLAARYVFLAGRTYDYETSLLGSSSKAGQNFLTSIIRQRSLGQFVNDEPVHGVSGLSDPMSRMKLSFDSLKGPLGFNNPQMETGQFSLRHELFRLRDASDEEWQEVLADHCVDDLRQLPEFKKFCRPFAPESAGPQPGLVIPFSTNINYGLNFFGWPLAGGDSAYDSSRFATKAKSVGVWFENYSGLNLSTTPRVYLVPVGLDVLRSPTGGSFATREFNVVDQALPDPFPIGASDFSNPRYIPFNDSLDNSFTAIRQFPRFRAYHSAGNGNLPLLNEMSTDTRIIGRSVWNTRWLLIIPGGTFLNNADDGMDTFIFGKKVPGSSTQRDGNGNLDIKLFFETYSYSGL